MLTPVFELQCDHCPRGDTIKWPVGAEDVVQAWGIVEREMGAAGWEQTRGRHKCPACVAREKHGPAQWTHKADPKDVMRLEVPDVPFSAEYIEAMSEHRPGI